VYSLSAAGRRHLRAWLATPPTTVQLYIEPFLRLHLARGGTIEDLRASVQAAEQTADDLLRTAVEVAGEFLDGRHLFQQDLALRGLLFDGLWGQGLALKEWAMTAQQELARWPGLDGDEMARGYPGGDESRGIVKTCGSAGHALLPARRVADHAWPDSRDQRR
jgi:hypothetical protein